MSAHTSPESRVSAMRAPPAGHWRRQTIPITAAAIAEAVSAMQHVLDCGYITAVRTELEVCLAGCRTDAERAQVFLWLMPHLRRQVERKAKQDSERFRNRAYSRRTW